MVLSSQRHLLFHLIEGTIAQMGSLELVDESLVSTTEASRKTPSLDAAPNRSFNSDTKKKLSFRSMLCGVVNSIRVVFFSNKLNLLAPFGPLAVVVDVSTRHHVSS